MDILGYGVCRLALVPVRMGPEEHAPQVTQLLFGDHYELLRVHDKHSRIYIRIHMDGMEGWIDAGHHHGITQDYFEQINLANFKITTDLTCSILYKKSPLTILLGSIVPISNSELFKMEEQFAFNGESKSLGQKREFEFVKTIAQKYLNAPQVAGGKSPFGIDASGFVQMVMKISGYQLSRLPQQQINEGHKLQSLGEAKPGDIAFFNATKSGLHTGIILDEDRIIHVDGKVRIDYLNEDGILRLDTKVYTHQLVGLRRLIAAA
ncbi:MAG: C40 family peptidase [Cyclobacteriaceae bacterium]|nr:C40 family peptidase [Cyclobacteriaceae bacterium]